jgi:hypothetical protein
MRRRKARGLLPRPHLRSNQVAGELSWLFYELVRVLSPWPFYDYVTKFAIFGRLAEAAKRSEPLATAPAELLRAVLAELYAMVDEVGGPLACSP